MSSTEVTNVESAGVPEWMRSESTGATLGNVSPDDLKPPRLKILAGMSPEIMGGTPGASVGKFWMTIYNANLGDSVTGTLILVRKSYQLWAPRVAGSSQVGPLASASDGIHWDIPNQEFEIKHQGNPKVYKWRIGKLVTEYGMTKWGSSQSDDPKSKPAATKTYNTLWVVDMPNGSRQLCVFTNARTGINPTENFFSTVRAMGVDQYFQRYRIVAEKRTGPTGDPYFTYNYQYLGNIQDRDQALRMKGLFTQYSSTGFVTDIEAEAEEIDANKPSRQGATPVGEDIDDSIPF